ncbi:hypothetical protein MJO28_007433 [Puccinia striiformis f. sp. tritici]|uniref:Uncharacterized protein n=1 Tax=Puccinia striiformis f. sp. tritici TaxID=168172 RepID=A0ACC0EG30_9BASI|nr:hypothetical protein MJO28_007433 [Puccinia striiformis f. sp. tritici]
MKSSHTYPHSETEKVSAEPPDVDISKLDPTKNPSNRLPSSSTNSNSTQQKMNPPENSARQLRSDPSIDRSSINSSIPPNAADPMLLMMKAMGLKSPNQEE